MRTARLSMFGLVSLVAAMLSAPASAEQLKNDGWAPNQTESFQAGLVSGEIPAARLVPQQECPCEITSIELLYGGAATERIVTLMIWDDSAGTLAPGSQKLSEQFELVPNDDQLQVIDLSAAPVIVDGPFRVGVVLQNEGLPSVAIDDDGTITTARNFLFSQGNWFSSGDAGLNRDWIIRATIADTEEPLCARPVTTGEEPKTSDCLFILRSAVGQISCSPACVCDPNGSGGITAGDALLCLKRAVGQPAVLNCMCE